MLPELDVVITIYGMRYHEPEKEVWDFPKALHGREDFDVIDFDLVRYSSICREWFNLNR
jgi:hypothetical protein